MLFEYRCLFSAHCMQDVCSSAWMSLKEGMKQQLYNRCFICPAEYFCFVFVCFFATDANSINW